MIADAHGVVVATTHQALREALSEAGALTAGSVADVEEVTASGAAFAVLASQEFPGLDPDRVAAWVARGLPVLLWVEKDPPPSWTRGSVAAQTVSGEIADEDVNRWIASAAVADELAPGARVHGVLGLGQPVTELVLRWSGRFGQKRGPGLLVDADWSGGGLTEALAAHVWGRVWDFGSAHAVPVSGGQLLPAPPPWVVGGDERGAGAGEEVASGMPWVMVDLGGDFRKPSALMWISRLDVVVVDGSGRHPTRVRETLQAIRALNREAVLGYRGDEAVGVSDAVRLGALWPRMPQPPEKGSPRAGRLGRTLVEHIREVFK